MVLRIRQIVHALVLLAAAAIAGSCSSTPTGQSNDVVVQASMKQLGLGLSVTRVELLVVGETTFEETQNGQLEDGLVTFRVEDVPTGETISFTMSAYNASQVVLYSGTYEGQFSPGVDATIDIQLTPQVPLVRVTPVFDQIGGAAGNGEISIEVRNVDNLFGISFRLEFAPNVVQVGDVTQGPLFGSSQTIFFSRTETDYVAVGVTMQGSQSPQGVDGGGVVATIEIQPGSALGRSDLTINPETLQLVDWQGNLLPLTGQLYIDNGEVQVIAR